MTENTVKSLLTDTTYTGRSDVQILYEFWFLCDEVNCRNTSVRNISVRNSSVLTVEEREKVNYNTGFPKRSPIPVLTPPNKTFLR